MLKYRRGTISILYPDFMPLHFSECIQLYIQQYTTSDQHEATKFPAMNRWDSQGACWCRMVSTWLACIFWVVTFVVGSWLQWCFFVDIMYISFYILYTYIYIYTIQYIIIHTSHICITYYSMYTHAWMQAYIMTLHYIASHSSH